LTGPAGIIGNPFLNTHLRSVAVQCGRYFNIGGVMLVATIIR